MTRVLITGGTGLLGQVLTPRIRTSGYTVRIMSRRERNTGDSPDVEWAQASLEHGTGLAEAVADVDVIIHAASTPVKKAVDVDGTQHMLDAAQAAGVAHFVYISIVGIDRIGFSYYQNKLEAEKRIESAGVPWTILRATQFHDFIDRLLGLVTRFPVALIPAGWQFQSISAEEVADSLVAAIAQGPSGRLPDIGGPEVLRLESMTRVWLAAQNQHKPILQIPVPGKLSAGVRRGLNTIPDQLIGQQTWAEFVAARYGSPVSKKVSQPTDHPVQGGYRA